MSVKGKKKTEFVAVTLTDFGNPNRRSCILKHFSLAAAFRSYRRTWDIYWKLNGHKVWIEDVVKGVPKGGMAEGL
jgi:hypothetical protein